MVFIHLRLGDMEILFPDTERSFADYTSAVDAALCSSDTLSSRRRRHIFIASDNPQHLLAPSLAKHCAPAGLVVDLDRIGTLQLAAVCKHLVVSDGSFSWMAAAMHVPATGSSVSSLPRTKIDPWGGDIWHIMDWDTITTSRANAIAAAFNESRSAGIATGSTAECARYRSLLSEYLEKIGKQ